MAEIVYDQRADLERSAKSHLNQARTYLSLLLQNYGLTFEQAHVMLKEIPFGDLHVFFNDLPKIIENIKKDPQKAWEEFQARHEEKVLS